MALRAGFFALVLLVAAMPAAAETFKLKDGSRVEGELLSEKSTFYRVRLADGSEEVVFKSDIAGALDLAPAEAPEVSESGELVIESLEEEASEEEAEVAPAARATPVHREWLKGRAGYKTALAGGPDRAIALYFSTSWCGYCKIFDRQVLGSAKVKKFLAGVNKVRLNGDKEKELMRKHEVTGYPTFLVVREKDGFRQRIRTGSSAEEFIQDCQAAGLGV